jgi:hypothetical protein
MMKGETMNKTGKTMIAAGACAACCAPLIWPFVSAALVGGGGSLAIGRYPEMDLETLLCLAGLVSAGIGAAYFGYRYWKQKGELEEVASCEIGGACDPR